MNHRFPARAAMLMLVVLCVARVARAGDWPTYMGDNTRAGVTAEAAPSRLNEQWVFHSPAPPRPIWPVPQPGWTELPKVKFDDAFYAVADSDTVYFGSSADNCVHALDAATGASRWRFFTGGAVRLAPTLSDGRVYFGSDDGFVYCVNKNDGALVWSFNAAPEPTRVLGNGRIGSLWPVHTSVLVEGDRLYFGAGVFPYHRTFAFALDSGTGQQIWKRADVAVYGGFSPQGYLLATKAGIVFPAGRSSPVCLNRDNGDVVFNTGSVQNFKGETTGVYGVVFDDTFFCGSQNTLFGVNAKGACGVRLTNTVRLVPTAEVFYSLQGPPSPAYGRKSISTDNNTITALSHSAVRASNVADVPPVKSAKIWAYKRPGLTSMIVSGKGLFAGANDSVVLINTITGKEVWAGKVDGSAVGLVFANGRLIVSTATGSVYCFAAGDAPKSVATTAPSPIASAAPASVALAQGIVTETKLKRGFALVTGKGCVDLALELAKQTELSITCVEPDTEKLLSARERVYAAGFYGHRITVEPVSPNALPYPDYAANLFVQLEGAPLVPAAEVIRVLKPCGGVLLTTTLPGDAESVFRNNQLNPQSVPLLKNVSLLKFTRGELPGSGWWTHQYADAGNTGSSGDKLVKGRLGMLWYGEPGGDEAPDRHRRGSAPLMVNGRVFTQGWQFLAKQTSIICFDAYNGVRYWETPIPNLPRLELPGVTSNLACDADSLFVAAEGSCYRIDAITGEVKMKYDAPQSQAATTAPTTQPATRWSYVAVVDGVLLGSASSDSDVYADRVFAMDVSTGKLYWTQQGREVRNTTLAIGDGNLYFAQNRYGPPTPKPSPVKKAAPKPKPVEKTEEHDGDGPDDDDDSVDRLGNVAKPEPVMRTINAVKILTGEPMWEREADLTHCGRWGPGAFGTLQALCKNGVLLLASANTPYGGGPKPEAGIQAALALSTRDGSTLWGNEVGNRSRPIFMQNAILAEPNFIDMNTGLKITRTGETLAGKERAWSTSSRAGCGSLSASDSMIFGRSGFTLWQNVAGPGGSGAFVGVRPGCLINIIPAGGVVVQPDASSGCACYQAIQCTIVLHPVPFQQSATKPATK